MDPPAEWQFFEASLGSTPSAPLPMSAQPLPSPQPLSSESLVAFESAKQSELAAMEGIRSQLDALVLSNPTNQALLGQASELGARLEEHFRQATSIGPWIAAHTLDPPRTQPAISLEEFAKLEQRVAKLEAAVFSSSLGKSGDDSLFSLVAKLEARVALLSEENVAAAARKARQLADELTSLHRLHKSSEGHTSLLKVDEVFNRLESVDAAAQTIPALLARLQSLKDVHLLASRQVVQLGGIEAALAELSEQAEHDRAVLVGLDKSLKDNLEVMRSNGDMLRRSLA